jgi:hypothetical protein
MCSVYLTGTGVYIRPPSIPVRYAIRTQRAVSQGEVCFFMLPVILLSYLFSIHTCYLTEGEKRSLARSLQGKLQHPTITLTCFVWCYQFATAISQREGARSLARSPGPWREACLLRVESLVVSINNTRQQSPHKTYEDYCQVL